MSKKNHLNRRNFLRQSALAVAGTLFVPSFLKAFDGRGNLARGQRTLIVIQLGGGNDGLNTVVPYGNDLYYNARPRLGIPASEVLKLDDMQGLNPVMENFRKLFDEGQLSILNAVGYPNPNRSHFRSMDIWHTASESHEYLDSGWLGRYLDQNAGDDALPTRAIESSEQLSLALKGESARGLAVRNARQFYQSTASPRYKQMVEAHEDHDHPPLVDYLYQTLTNSISSAEYIFETSKTATGSNNYPLGRLPQQLRGVSQMIRAGLETRVYYIQFSGFDTHVGQRNKQARLLGQLDKAVGAFAKDLKAHGKWEDTLIMTFSEFGRRVKQNASNGTDHGTANNLFLLGGNLKKPGIVNAAPNLKDLDEGDLKYKIDFRDVYADVLQNWLGANPATILNGSVRPIGLL